jgi:hypothetical protein
VADTVRAQAGADWSFGTAFPPVVAVGGRYWSLSRCGRNRGLVYVDQVINPTNPAPAACRCKPPVSLHLLHTHTPFGRN